MIITFFGNNTKYSNHNRVCCHCGESRSFTLTVRFVADEAYLFLRKPDTNYRPTHFDSHETTANIEISMSEQLQENELKINRATPEEEAADYTSLDLSKVQENHVYDVIPR